MDFPPAPGLRLLLAAVLASGLAGSPRAQMAFEDVTDAAGVSHLGGSWGAAWGHLDGDIYPDLWVTNHNKPFALFRNQGDGTFVDLAATVIGNALADQHGPAWGDFDNDGDQDLMQTVGAQSGVGSGSDQFFVNDNGVLTDEAAAYGLEFPQARGRSALWFDWDRDGFLDLLLSNNRRPDGLAPTALFSQRDGVFVDESLTVGLDATQPTFFAQVTGSESAGFPLLLVHAPHYPQRAYRTDLGNFVDVKPLIGLDPTFSGTAMDAAVADFDGNLQPDVFVTSQVDTSDFEIEDDTSVKAFLTVLAASQRGLEITTDGDLQIAVTPDFYVELDEIHIGSGGEHPTDHIFSVSASDPAHEGLVGYQPGVDFGVYIGRDPVAGTWQVFVTSPDWVALDLLIVSDQTIASVDAVGFSPFDGRQEGTLLTRSGAAFIDSTAGSGLEEFRPCTATAAGDFDNDMDVDLYLVCRSMVGNHPNILLENQGGTFTVVPGGGGAEGSTEGRGENVAVADYDVDGFLDLFVMNGLGFGAFSNGPDQLFRNLGNGNHWLEFDLEGVVQNRDGIGARVFVVAGGTTQVRELDGGAHRYAQNHARLHFGLGANTKADAVLVQWPGGAQQSFGNLPADQLVHVLERSNPSFVGAPSYTPGVDRGVYLWQDSAGGAYHLRVSGDNTVANYAIRVVSMAPLSGVTTVDLGPSDAFAQTATSFLLVSNVLSEEDGVDFSLFPGATALVSVERDGVRDPKDLHVGPQGLPITPAGWIAKYSTLPALPAFVSGQDLGLVIGKDGATNTVQVRWSADSYNHKATVLMMSGGPLSGASAVALEAGDTFVPGAYSVFSQGTVEGDHDGFDVTSTAGAMVGLIYYQDGLVQRHRVNPAGRELGLPNAYLLK